MHNSVLLQNVTPIKLCERSLVVNENVPPTKTFFEEPDVDKEVALTALRRFSLR